MHNHQLNNKFVIGDSVLSAELKLLIVRSDRDAFKKKIMVLANIHNVLL